MSLFRIKFCMNILGVDLLIESSMQIGMIRMELSISSFKGSQVGIYKIIVMYLYF